MADCLETTVAVRDAQVFLRRGGAGKPLLYLHGAGGLPGWLPFLGRLADRYDVLAPDHLSFGRSPRPEWLDSIADLAYFYLDFLAALDLRGVHLVGHSMGGWIAQEIAIRSTTRLASLTLIDSAGIRIKGKPAADIFMMDREQQVRALYANPKLVEQVLATPLTAEQENLAIDNRVAAARLCWQPRLFNPKLRTWLHRIDVPTHIIWGDSDRIIAPEYGPELRSLIPGATLTMMAACGHSPQVEHPEATVASITDFIGR
jgi:pimeloyl-ACP methyl ester carboxylesterase